MWARHLKHGNNLGILWEVVRVPKVGVSCRHQQGTTLSQFCSHGYDDTMFSPHFQSAMFPWDLCTLEAAFVLCSWLCRKRTATKYLSNKRWAPSQKQLKHFIRVLSSIVVRIVPAWLLANRGPTTKEVIKAASVTWMGSVVLFQNIK